MNDKFFGKIDASTKMDRQGYQYVITGLNPEESYDAKVKVRMKNVVNFKQKLVYNIIIILISTCCFKLRLDFRDQDSLLFWINHLGCVFFFSFFLV